MELQRVAPADLLACAFNPRRRFDASELNELAASIEKVGVLEPLVARRRPDGKLEIVAGERRWRAAMSLAAPPLLPVVVRELDDRETAEAMLAENLQRADLTPLEEARAFQAWCQAAAKGAPKQARPNWPAQLAAKIGKGEDYVRERLRLLELEPEVRDAIEAGRVTLKAARLLHRVTDKKARAEILRAAVEGELTPSFVAEAAAKSFVDLDAAPFDLQTAAPSCQGCIHRKFRDGTELLPARRRGSGNDPGVCTKPECFMQKGREYWAAQGARVIEGTDGSKHFPVEAWKKDCAGCKPKAVAVCTDFGGRIYQRLCMDSGAHYAVARYKLSAAELANLKREAQKERKRRTAFEKLRGQYAETLAKKLLRAGFQTLALRELDATFEPASWKAIGCAAKPKDVRKWAAQLEPAALAKATAIAIAHADHRGPWQMADLKRALAELKGKK